MSAVDLLSEIIAQGARVAIASLAHRPEFGVLFNCGLLGESEVVLALTCDKCDDPHAAEVVFDDGAYGYFCPDLGFTHLSRHEIASVEPNLPSLIERLASAFDCKRRRATPVYGKTWRIGAVPTDQGDVMLYFHPRLLDGDDVRSLADALSREVASTSRLIITAGGCLPVHGAGTVPLSEFVDMRLQDGCFFPLADPRVLVGVPLSKKNRCA